MREWRIAWCAGAAGGAGAGGGLKWCAGGGLRGARMVPAKPFAVILHQSAKSSLAAAQKPLPFQ